MDDLMDEDENEAVSALPRRMSEVNAATKIQPIPPATSFFIFSQKNRFFFRFLNISKFFIFFLSFIFILE
jgi:hypothetical protein